MCDQCGQSFPHLAALVAHAEAAHQTHSNYTRTVTTTSRPVGGGGGGGTSAGREVCPQCGVSFPDIVSLVSHVEAKHEGKKGKRAASPCVIC